MVDTALYKTGGRHKRVDSCESMQGNFSSYII